MWEAMILKPAKVELLLKKFGIHAPAADQDRGTALRITCHNDALGRKQIAVACLDFESFKPCPLTTEDAASIVNALHERHLIPGHAHEGHTLEHLLLRCSELFVAEDLESLSLAPVYLRENDYRVAHAEMAHKGPVEAKARLDPDAHDKSAVFDYRPTARGRAIPKPPVRPSPRGRT